MNKVIEYIIRAKDMTGTAISSATNKVKSFSTAVGSQLMNIKAGLDMAMGAVRTFASAFAAAIKEAFRFEKAVSDFKVLLGSVDQAKEHIADLKQFAASTPLTFGDLSQASKLLLSFGADVEKVMPSLKMLGDISMGNAQKFQGLALVFAQVQSAGKLMGQDLLQMINQGFNPLTIIAQETGKSVAELKDIMSDGGISFEMVAEAMRIATSEGGLFNGAMEESAKTGEGLMSTLEDNWTEAVRTFGEAFSGEAKGGIQQLIDKLTELNENGSIEKWAKEAARWLGSFVDGAKTVVGWIANIYKYTGAADAVNMVQGVFKGTMDAVGGAVGAIAGGGGIGDAWRSARENFNSAVTREIAEDGFYFKGASEDIGRKRGWIVDEPPRNKPKDGKPKDGKPKDGKPKDGKGGKTLEEMFAEIKKRLEEERKKKEEEKAAKEAEKHWKAYEREMEKALREEERAREAAEREAARERDRLWKAHIRQAETDLNALQTEQSNAEAALAAAQDKVRQAWGWYRDKDSLKAQIEEEKAEAAAQKQFEKDFEKLKGRRRDWRTADNLSLDEEAVRRVGVALEEERAALQYAKETAENTKELATTLEQLLEMKEN